MQNKKKQKDSRPYSAHGAAKKLQKQKKKRQSVLNEMPGYNKKKYNDFGNEI